MNKKQLKIDKSELEKAYAEASKEIDPIWDITIGDGLDELDEPEELLSSFSC